MGALVFVFPLSFCYYFLYYTDTLSTLALLLCYWLSVASSHPNRPAHGVLSSFLDQLLLLASACVAILARQTNAVWVLFIAGTGMLRFLQEKQYFR